MPSTRLLILLLVTAALSACAMPSDHHPADYRGGFSETQIDRTAFRVTYRGNIAQTQMQTDELALLRSAELAKSHGYGYFTSGGNAATGTALGGFFTTVSVPATTLTIVCYPTRPDTNGLVYDAGQVIANYGPKYGKL